MRTASTCRVAILSATLLSVASCAREPAANQGSSEATPADKEPTREKRIQGALRLESSIRGFDFLAAGEVAVDVTIENVGKELVVIDVRTDEARENHGDGAVYRPRDPFEFLSVRSEPLGALKTEQRLSDSRRHYDELEDGAILKGMEPLLPLTPGTRLILRTIMWSPDPKRPLGDATGQIDFNFAAPMAMAPASEGDVVRSVIGGMVLKDKDAWLSRSFSSIAVAGQLQMASKTGK